MKVSCFAAAYHIRNSGYRLTYSYGIARPISMNCKIAEKLAEKFAKTLFTRRVLSCYNAEVVNHQTRMEIPRMVPCGVRLGPRGKGSMRKNLTKRRKNMSVISMKQLLEAGVHFGHQTRRWNPKMAPYIYTERNGIYIIDLQQSVGMVDDAYNAVADIVANGGNILFVGTKKQAQDAIKTEAERCGQFYVNERWLGGMLTNFKTIQSRIARLKEIETMELMEHSMFFLRKKLSRLRKELDKLQKNLGGIKEMKRLPDAIFVVDPKKERICVQEAHTLGIPLIGICDTNCDPEELDYVIPGNDDAIRAVKLIVSKMADAVIEANQGTADAEGEIQAESEEFATEE